VLGLGVGVGWWMWTRRRATKVHAAVLPEGFTATAGAALFGVAGVILLVQSLGLLVDGTSHGAGQWLSGAMVSLAVAATFAWSLFGTIRSRATT
jgi:protein-S-isoprenylcysteine O-methyltransferase Ste14